MSSLLQNFLDNLKQWWSGRTSNPTNPTKPTTSSGTFNPVPPYNPPPSVTPFGPPQQPTWTTYVPRPPMAKPSVDPPVDGEQMVAALLAAHNRQRQDNGLPALTLNSQLSVAAQRHADWMAQNRNMDHTEHQGPGFNAADFFTRIQNEGYNPRVAGENIAAGQTSVDQ